MVGPRKNSTVSIVTLTAAVPTYLSVHASGEAGARNIASAAAPQSTLLCTVK